MEGYLSEIRFFAGNFAPDNWQFCNGQELQISAYQELYDLIGTIYGGDGKTTFALPDLRGRSAVGQGQGEGLSSYTLGMKIGATQVALTGDNMPPHTHVPLSSLTSTATPLCSTSTATSDDPDSNYLAVASNGDAAYNSAGLERMGPSKLTTSGSITCESTGEGYEHFNIQPSLVSSYIICTNGETPVKD